MARHFICARQVVTQTCSRYHQLVDKLGLKPYLFDFQGRPKVLWLLFISFSGSVNSQDIEEHSERHLGNWSDSISSPILQIHQAQSLFFLGNSRPMVVSQVLANQGSYHSLFLLFPFFTLLVINFVFFLFTLGGWWFMKATN